MKILDMGAMFGYDCAQIFANKQHEVINRIDVTKDIMQQLQGIDLVIFGGGDDVDPKLYGHENVASGHPNVERDKIEKAVFDASQRIYSQKRLGICRGAQFLNVMHGGWMVQHVNGHAGAQHLTQLAFRRSNRTSSIMLNSYHHQMMVPSMNAMVIGWTDSLSDEYIYDTARIGLGGPRRFNPKTNAEIVLFTGHDLGVQAHPEYLPPDHEMPTLVREIVDNYFGMETV